MLHLHKEVLTSVKVLQFYYKGLKLKKTVKRDKLFQTKISSVKLQEPLTSVMRNQICSDVRDIPDICQILSLLDITIRVLSVTGADPESMLYNYMIDKLQMNRGVLTTKVLTTYLKFIESNITFVYVTFHVLIN
jgi:hypothetical protein